MKCVVCGAPVETAVYPNPFERARRIYACCSDGCAQRFDPDTHWIPGQPPRALDAAEEAKLLRVFGERLANGDRPTVVVREMLVAGVPAQRLRLQLGDQAAGAQYRRSQAVGISRVFGVFSIRRRRDKRDPKAIAQAARDRSVALRLRPEVHALARVVEALLRERLRPHERDHDRHDKG